MTLGAFSISLPVQDLDASRAFYEALGFSCWLPDDADPKWAILTNPDGHMIGLFVGMFEKPMLTFNPGWDQAEGHVDPFDDVRDWYRVALAAGLPVSEVELDAEAGPGSFVVIDPDGHPILIDQHR